MVGTRTRAAGWKEQTNPLSYGGTPNAMLVFLLDCLSVLGVLVWHISRAVASSNRESRLESDPGNISKSIIKLSLKLPQ